LQKHIKRNCYQIHTVRQKVLLAGVRGIIYIDQKYASVFLREITMKTSDMIVGIGLVILGFLFLSENFGYIEFNFQNVWPVFVMLGGIGFTIGYLQDRKNYGLLMPASILTIYGLLFFYCSIEGWYMMSVWWPVFIIGPGIGFFMMYILGGREKGLLFPATILTVIGLLFLISHSGFWRYWPLVLIIIGIVMIVRHYSGQAAKEKSSEKSNL